MTRVHFPTFVKRWNAIQSLTTPALHGEIAHWLNQNWKGGERKLLLMAFRNAGKSTIVGLFCAWALARNPATRIMVLAADQALARKMVRNTKRIVERHPLTEGLKPKRADQWAADQFTVNRDSELRDPSMLARGITSNVTGSRADIIICDDVEVPNTCDTAPKREDLRERLGEIDYVLVPGGLTLYVGTPHTHCSLYAKTPCPDTDEEVAFLDGFARLVLPILDEAGRSRWPERFSEKKIESIRKRTGPAKFASQMMLRPRNIVDGRLAVDKLVRYEAPLDYREAGGEAVLTLGDGAGGSKRLVSASCWWDPAFGAPDKGDASVIACVFSDEDGAYWLHDVRYLTFDRARITVETEAEQQCRGALAFAHDHHLPSVTVETNGIGRFLPGLLRKVIAEDGADVGVLERTNKIAKAKRILAAFDAPLAAGRIHAHAQIWQTPFIREMREWRPGAKGPDDGLDAVAGCLLSEPVRIPFRTTRVRTPRPRWQGGSHAIHADGNFEI